jgi:hypothetical protein
MFVNVSAIEAVVIKLWAEITGLPLPRFHSVLHHDDATDSAVLFGTPVLQRLLHSAIGVNAKVPAVLR